MRSACHNAIADGGIKIQQQQRREADSLISQLEQIGRTQQPPPLSNPLLFGNYNVAYTSSGDDQRGQRELLQHLGCVGCSNAGPGSKMQPLDVQGCLRLLLEQLASLTTARLQHEQISFDTLFLSAS